MPQPPPPPEIRVWRAGSDECNGLYRLAEPKAGKPSWNAENGMRIYWYVSRSSGAAQWRLTQSGDREGEHYYQAAGDTPAPPPGAIRWGNTKSDGAGLWGKLPAPSLALIAMSDDAAAAAAPTAERAGAEAEAMSKTMDTNCSGTLDRLEVQLKCSDLGMSSLHHQFVKTC